MRQLDWNYGSIEALFSLPFFELVQLAYSEHKTCFTEKAMELCSLLSIKTGACPEDCAYCPQSAHHKKTGLVPEKLLPLDRVLVQAQQAKSEGATRFCMGGAWRTRLS